MRTFVGLLVNRIYELNDAHLSHLDYIQELEERIQFDEDHFEE
jgi:hypothetical protein